MIKNITDESILTFFNNLDDQIGEVEIVSNKNETSITSNKLHITQQQYDRLMNDLIMEIDEEEYDKLKDNNQNELQYYTYGFNSPNINELNTKEQKDNVYNKLLNQFKEELKEWIY